jgi:hypothetical protein
MLLCHKAVSWKLLASSDFAMPLKSLPVVDLQACCVIGAVHQSAMCRKTNQGLRHCDHHL